MPTEIAAYEASPQAARRRLQNNLFKVALATPGKWFCIEVGEYSRQDRLRVRNAVRASAAHHEREIHTVMGGDQLLVMIEPVSLEVA